MLFSVLTTHHFPFSRGNANEPEKLMCVSVHPSIHSQQYFIPISSQKNQKCTKLFPSVDVPSSSLHVCEWDTESSNVSLVAVLDGKCSISWFPEFHFLSQQQNYIIRGSAGRIGPGWVRLGSNENEQKCGNVEKEKNHKHAGGNN